MHFSNQLTIFFISGTGKPPPPADQTRPEYQKLTYPEVPVDNASIDIKQTIKKPTINNTSWFSWFWKKICFCCAFLSLKTIIATKKHLCFEEAVKRSPTPAKGYPFHAVPFNARLCHLGLSIAFQSPVQGFWGCAKPPFSALALGLLGALPCLYVFKGCPREKIRED